MKTTQCILLGVSNFILSINCITSVIICSSIYLRGGGCVSSLNKKNCKESFLYRTWLMKLKEQPLEAAGSYWTKLEFIYWNIYHPICKLSNKWLMGLWTNMSECPLAEDRRCEDSLKADKISSNERESL